MFWFETNAFDAVGYVSAESFDNFLLFILSSKNKNFLALTKNDKFQSLFNQAYQFFLNLFFNR